jgi:hypothetical protein
MEQNGRSPLELFLFRFWKDWTEVANALELSVPTARMWREHPERMLKYIIQIRELTGCTYTEIVDVVKEARLYVPILDE